MTPNYPPTFAPRSAVIAPLEQPSGRHAPEPDRLDGDGVGPSAGSVQEARHAWPLEAQAQPPWTRERAIEFLDKVASLLPLGRLDAPQAPSSTADAARSGKLCATKQQLQGLAFDRYLNLRYPHGLSTQVPPVIRDSAQQYYPPGHALTTLEEVFVHATIALRARTGYNRDVAMLALSEAVLQGTAGGMTLMRMTHTDGATVGAAAPRFLILAGSSHAPASVRACKWKHLALDTDPGAFLIDPIHHCYAQLSKPRWKKTFSESINGRSAAATPRHNRLVDNSIVTLMPLVHISPEGLTAEASIGTRPEPMDDLPRLPLELHALWRDDVRDSPRMKLVDLGGAFAHYHSDNRQGDLPSKPRLFLLFDIYDALNADLRFEDVLTVLDTLSSFEDHLLKFALGTRTVVITIGTRTGHAPALITSRGATIDSVATISIARDTVCHADLPTCGATLWEQLARACMLADELIKRSTARIRAALEAQAMDPRTFHQGLDPRLARGNEPMAHSTAARGPGGLSAA